MSTVTRGADQIVQSISLKLSNGTLKQGDRLPSEAKLCEEYSVSRTVVREAIQQMKAMGVINTITGSGSYISEGSLTGFQNSLEFFASMTGDTQNWIELLQLRMLIESACVREVAGPLYSPEKLTLIKDAFHKMEEHNNDSKLYASLDVAFHHTIIQAAENKLFLAMITAVQNTQRRFSTETSLSGERESLLKRLHTEHQAIVNAIEQRDPDLAEKCMREHLDNTINHLKLFLKEKETTHQ